MRLLFEMDVRLTPGAMAKIAGMALWPSTMAGDARLSAMPYCVSDTVDLMNRFRNVPLPSWMYVSMVSALAWMPSQRFRTGCTRHLQSVEVPAAPKQDHGGFGTVAVRLRGSGLRRDGGNEHGGEMEHLIRVCDQAPSKLGFLSWRRFHSVRRLPQ